MYYILGRRIVMESYLWKVEALKPIEEFFEGVFVVTSSHDISKAAEVFKKAFPDPKYKILKIEFVRKAYAE
jgi:hypothetical protein